MDIPEFMSLDSGAVVWYRDSVFYAGLYLILHSEALRTIDALEDAYWDSLKTLDRVVGDTLPLI